MNRRRNRPTVRFFAGALVLMFLFVSVMTTVRSVGQYCLTSDGGDTSRLPR